MGRDSSVRAVVDRALAAIGHLDPPAYEASYISTELFARRRCEHGKGPGSVNTWTSTRPVAEWIARLAGGRDPGFAGP